MGTMTMERNVSYSSIEATRLIYQPIFKDLIGLGYFRVMPNVVNKKRIQYIDKLEGIVQKANGCGFTPKGATSIYNRTVEVNDSKVELSFCFDQFLDTIFEEKLKKGANVGDLQGTEIMAALLPLIQESMTADYLRLFWFGDTSSLDDTNNITDGIWSVHVPALVAANKIPYTNTSSGAALSPGDGLAYIKDVYDDAPLNLKGLANSEKRILVSGTVWEQYMEDLEALGGGDAGRMMLIDGVTRMYFRGVEVIGNYNWDYFNQKYLGLSNQHQILYTTPDNLIFATDLLSSQNSLDIWFEKKEEVTDVRAKSKIGTNYTHESFFSVGY
jgi:hypothetical protein